MAASERKVGITLILKDKMSKSLTKADKQAKKLRKSGDDIIKTFKKSWKPFAVLTGAITGAAAAVFILNKRVANFGDTMIKSAQRLNLSTDAYQKFDHAMQLSGTSMQANRGALTRFARTARDAVNGVKIAEEAFIRLGISVRDNDGSFKQTEELMMEVSDAFATMPSTIEKTALMMDLFGRSGAQMSQFLSLGSESLKEVGRDAERLGGVMSESAAKGAEKFIDALTRMELAFDGLLRDIAETTQPMFTKAMESMANSIVSLRKAFMPVYKDFMRNSKQVAQVVIPIMGWMGQAVIGFGTTVALTWKAILMTGNQLISGFIRMNNAVLKAFEWVTGITIAPLADDFGQTALEIDSEMANIIDASAAAMGAIDNLTDAVMNVNTKIYTTADSVDKARDAADKLGTISKKLTDEELANYKKILDWRKRATEDYNDAVKNAADARFAYQVMITNKVAEEEEALQQKKLRHLEELRSEAEETTMRFAKAGASIGDAFISGFEAAEEGQSRMIEGLKSAAQESINIGLDVMEEQVINYAKTAAAGAASSVSSIPVIGPAMAAAAAAAMFALVKGFINMGFSNMAEGGFVTGGVANRDSVPAMLMPGEYVMSKKEVAAAQGGGGPGGAPVFNIELSSSLPPSRAEMKKFVRQNIVPALRELRTQGMY